MFEKLCAGNFSKVLISSVILALTQFAVDDDAKSVPESLEQIGSRLRALESNQTSVSGQLARISSSVNKIMVSQERTSDTCEHKIIS